MPTIHTYDAPTQRLRPEEKGYAALETEGRRLGPLFNQAASDYEKIGRVTAETIRQRSWPYNILDLQNSRGGGGVRIKDTRPSASRAAFGGRSGDDGYGDFNQVTNGMGAFGDGWAKAQADADKQNAQQLRDRNAAVDYNNKVWDNTQKNWADRMKAEAVDDAATRKALGAEAGGNGIGQDFGGGGVAPPEQGNDYSGGSTWGDTFGAIGGWMADVISGGSAADTAASTLENAGPDYFTGTSQ